MAQPIDNETICPNTSKGQKQFFINNYSPKRCGLFFWTQPEVQVGGPWVCLDTLQCPEHRRGGRRGQPPAPHSLFPPRPPPISLSLALYLVTLVQGLEWAATSFPLPGRSHNSVFCSWKKREKNQRGWEGLLPSPSLEMPKLGCDIVP